MKASELVKELQEAIEKHGDLNVCIYDEEDGGWYEGEVYLPAVTGVKKTTKKMMRESELNEPHLYIAGVV